MSNTNNKHPPLPIPREKWRRRWMVLGSWNCLHRISEIEWEDEDEIAGEGVSVCGQRGRYQIPGIFSHGTATLQTLLPLPRDPGRQRVAG